MPKQIVLHYAGSYVERPHTITFDSEREYQKFIEEKGYRLKPNVEYGVFTLNSILRTQFQQSSIKIEDVSEADKPDISTITPPTIDIKYPQCKCSTDKEEDNNQGNNQGDTDTPPKDGEEGNDTPPVVTPSVEIVITSPKVNVDRLVEEKAKSNLNSVNVEFDKVGNVITITGDINDLQEYPSSVAVQGSGKWIPLEIGTGLPTIVGAKFNGAELTEADRQEALGLGMAEGSFVLWIKATEDYDRDITIEKDGVTKTIKIKFNNTPKETPTPVPGESDDDVIIVGGEDENQDTPPADNQEEDVVVIGGDEDTQNPTEDPDTTDTTTGTDTQTGTTDTTGTTDDSQNGNQGADEGFNRVGPVVSFGPEVTGNDGEESQTDESQDSGDSEIIIPDEGSSESTSPTPGDEDIIVL